MEQGGMRLEANISLTTDETKLPDYKVELKNINSFRFMEQAIYFEVERQAAELNAGATPIQETRGWDMNKQETYSQRTKEEAEDYRYFPDPDIPPIVHAQADIDRLQKQLPELPQTIADRWQATFQVEPRYAQHFVRSQTKVAWAEQLFTAAKKANVEPNALANAIVNKKISANESQTAETVLENFSKQFATTSLDDATLSEALESLKQKFPMEWQRYQDGEKKLIGFFIGQLKRQLGRDIDTQQLLQLLQDWSNTFFPIHG